MVVYLSALRFQQMKEKSIIYEIFIKFIQLNLFCGRPVWAKLI